ncbi:MAG TPA: phosphate ABC transporter permease subunit PstC [Acidimicrobiales bacterium]|nr:phosphate ABC transporter permease subunit PstC [Acidimicrobiales bacterium]
MTTAEGAAGGLPAAPDAAPQAPRPPALRRVVGALRTGETGAWKWSARVAVVLPAVALAFAVTVLAVKAYPAIEVNGWHFFTGSSYKIGSAYAQTVRTDGVAHPEGSSYGVLALLVGTLQTGFIAVLVALPISIGCAFALTERLHPWLSRPLGFTIELLAGIPSVVLGLWGVLTFGPFLAKHVYPAIAHVMPNVAFFDWFKGTVGHGEGLLTGSLVLVLMIVPIITATTADLFRQVPPLPKEGGEALGMTDAEVASRITIPWVRSGIVGATALGLGRAIGETIAIAMISGSILHIAPNIYSPMSTIAAAIVTQLSSSLTDATGFATATLAEMALILAVISVGVNLVARWIVHRTSRIGGAVGRGA